MTERKEQNQRMIVVTFMFALQCRASAKSIVAEANREHYTAL
jgi:hypothetical protein